MLHEFAHAMMDLNNPSNSLVSRVTRAYYLAKQKRTFNNTYAMTSPNEYWAEGVQDWFDCNAHSIPSNGIHNHIHTRAQLRMADPALSAILAEYFGDTSLRYQCPPSEAEILGIYGKSQLATSGLFKVLEKIAPFLPSFSFPIFKIF
jgi:hypothetical protein